MIFLATVTGLGLAMVLMAVGVLVGRRRIEHGCGAACRCFGRDGGETGVGT